MPTIQQILEKGNAALMADYALWVPTKTNGVRHPKPVACFSVWPDGPDNGEGFVVERPRRHPIATIKALLTDISHCLH